MSHRLAGGYYFQVSGSSTITTTSGTYQTISGFTDTPPAGTYHVGFSVQMRNTTGTQNAFAAIHVDGTTDSDLEIGVRGAASGAASWVVGWSGTVTVDGTEAVDLRYKETTSGTAEIKSRSMWLQQVTE